ncbi:MAG: hypothetical protein IT489_05260 [Gammaproteobacteria bacterium]|nr:hypothetical protein [Gammaproteobacteria bacterium]
MPETCVCWKCGAVQQDLSLPLARLAECPSCRAELHVCRMCVYFDPVTAQQCREPVADAVADKQRANFCGYFQMRPNAFAAPSSKAEASRRGLEALFGGEAVASAPSENGNPEDLARKRLEELFKK